MGKRFEVLSSNPQTSADRQVRVGEAVGYRMGHFDSLVSASAFCDAIRMAWWHRDARIWIVDRGVDSENARVVVFDSAIAWVRSG